jgi:hypothetical protein
VVTPAVFLTFFSFLFLLSKADSGSCVMVTASGCHGVLQMRVIRAPQSPARRGVRLRYLRLYGALVH